MAARKLPARHKSGPKKGQFKKGPARAKAAPKRKAAPRKAAAKKAAPRKRNPPRPKMPDVVDTLLTGSVRATQILVGKAAARSVPDLAGLPKEGTMGLAVQAAVAVVAGYLATMFLSAEAAAAITAGGLSAPIETFIVAQDVPWIGRALAPTTAQATVGAYVQPKRALRKIAPGGGSSLAAYVQPPHLAPTVGAPAN